MDKGKIFKIIRTNGLSPENFTSVDNDGSIYVLENGTRYKLNGFSKKILINVGDVSKENTEETLTKLMSDYKTEVRFPDDIKIGDTVVWDNENTVVWDNENTEWCPPAGLTKGLIRTEEELERIKLIKKPRGWHFRDKFIDSEGNLYYKGVLQN